MSSALNQQPAQTPAPPVPPAQERQWARLENLLAVSQRLRAAIGADIAALEKGAIGELKTTDPEIEKLCAFYAREVKSLKSAGGIGRAPAKLIAALREEGEHLDAQLKIHEQLVAAMRDASEGLVQAVAEGVDKMRNSAAPYKPAQAQTQKRTASAGAIVYNKVV